MLNQAAIISGLYQVDGRAWWCVMLWGDLPCVKLIFQHSFPSIFPYIYSSRLICILWEPAVNHRNIEAKRKIWPTV